MQKTLLLIFALLLSFVSFAQIKEINPSIQWRFVKSQDLPLKDGKWYNYEFSAEKGFDYLFTMTHNSQGAKASIQVFDLQFQKIAEFKTDSSDVTAVLMLDVPQSGVYQVFFGVNLKEIPDETEVPVLFSLVRRAKV
jgi:hypothetical protein